MLLTPIPSTVGGINYVGGMSGFSGSNIAATDDHRWYWGAYGQDDWKVTPRLTLNLGLRWDYFTPYAETRGYQANFVPVGGNGTTGTYYMSKQGCAVPRSAAFNTLLTASNIALDCVSSLTLGSAQKTNFAPRIGFAYSVTQKVVARAGFGTAYGALGNLGYGGTLGTNYPFVYTQTFPSPDSQHPLLLPNGQPATMEQAFTQYNFQNPTVSTGLGLDLYGRQYNFQTPYIQTENLTIQYLLRRTTRSRQGTWEPRAVTWITWDTTMATRRFFRRERTPSFTSLPQLCPQLRPTKPPTRSAAITHCR